MERPFQMDDCPEQQTPHLSFCLPVERRSLLLLAHSNNSSENMTLPIDSFRLVYKVIGRATSHDAQLFLNSPSSRCLGRQQRLMGQRIIHGFIPLARSLKMAVTKESCAEKTNRPDPLSTEFFLAEDGGQIATPYRNLFLNIKIKL